MLSNYIERLVNLADDDPEREKVYKALEKLGMDRITADTVAKAQRDEEVCRFKKLRCNLGLTVVYEERTGVMYAVGNDGSMTPMVSMDGYILTYDRWQKMDKKW